MPHPKRNCRGAGGGAGDSLTNNVRRKVARKKKLKRKLMIHVRPRPQSLFVRSFVRSYNRHRQPEALRASMPTFLPCLSVLSQEVCRRRRNSHFPLSHFCFSLSFSISPHCCKISINPATIRILTVAANNVHR